MRSINIDSLTGLRDRRSFFQAVRGFQKKRQRFHIIMIQIVRFDRLNRKYGNSKGDILLQLIAEYLRNEVAGYEAFRIANSRYMLAGVPENDESAEKTASEIAERFGDYWKVRDEWQVYDIKIDAEVVHMFPMDTDTETQLLDKLNFMLFGEYAAYHDFRKALGFNSDVEKKFEHNRWVLEETKKAIQNKSFVMYYQPIFEPDSGKFVTAEALIRLWGENGEFISPGEFIPMAEEKSLIDQISWIVMEKVCRFLGENPALPLKSIAVNLTGQQILDPDFTDRIDKYLNEYRVDGSKLRIEITERTVVEDFGRLKEVMESLKEKGVRFYLDDFGTGYSNLSSMLTLPFEVVKFDKSLIDTMENGKKPIRTMGLLAEIIHENEYIIVAEGIERKEQVDVAKELKFDRIQGYYYAKPMSGEELITFLNDKRNE